MATWAQGKRYAVSAPLIVVVDDEPGLLRLFTALLDRLACEAVPAGGGAMALDILEQCTPDLLILDLAMPAVSGLDVLRRVRATPRLANMKVMILTARPNIVPEVEALGVDRWLSKPVLPGDFLDTVNSLL